MKPFDQVLDDLVAANRILAHEGVCDAFGHVSIRHPSNPERFLMSRSCSPELVELPDIMEFGLDGVPVGGDARQPYLERYIHGAIYEARPDIHAVVHSHTDDVQPFGLTDVPFRPVLHTAGPMGSHVPVWDIHDRFGDTNLLVVNVEQGRDLAARLGTNRVVLMRGHGFAAAGRYLLEAMKIAVYLPRNARALLAALSIGSPKYLSEGEVEILSKVPPDAVSLHRAWEYWKARAGYPVRHHGKTSSTR